MTPWDDILYNAGSFLSSDYTKWIGGAIGFMAFLFLIFYLGGSGLRRGTHSERRRWRHLGYSPFDIEGHTGRGTLRELTAAIRETIAARRLAKKEAREAGKIGKDIGTSTGALIQGEERNLEETLHLGSLAATSKELSDIILKLVNATLKDDEAKRAIEAKLSELDARLASIPIEELDEKVKDFIRAIGMQLTSALIELAYSEELRINVREKSFEEAYRALKDAKKADQMARRALNRAVRSQTTFKKYTERVIKDVEEYLAQKRASAKKGLTLASNAYSQAADESSRSNLRQQLEMTRAIDEQTDKNVKYLSQGLEQLRAGVIRMLQNLENAISDATIALHLIREATEKERELRDAEMEINKRARNLRSAARVAQDVFKAMEHKEPEEIIISLTTNASSIFNELIGISQTILEINERDLVEFMRSLEGAMQMAYKAEESCRLSGKYYEELLHATVEFHRLIVKADLSKDVKDAVSNEIRIEEIEERIARKEEGAEQAVKTLFISTINNIRNSKGAVLQHMEYLKNNITFMNQIRDYTVNVLTSVMQKITLRKMEAGGIITEQAHRFQEELTRTIASANIARGQIPVLSRLTA